MNDIYLPFQIGEQYENWEFDLDILETEKVPGCDSYLYNRTTQFIGVVPDTVELIFNLDILHLVIISLNNCSIHMYHNISTTLLLNFQKRECEKLEKDTYIITENIEIWCTTQLNNTYNIAYGYTHQLNKLLPT